MPSPLRTLLDGPPPALPAVLDRLAERWSRSSPRVRWWTVTLAVVALLALVGRGAVASPWGPPVDVVVAARDLRAGEVVGADDVAVASWPRDLAADAAHEADEVLGLVAVRPLGRGEPLRLDAVADGGLATGLAPQHAAVPVVDASAPPVTVGWRVDVVGQGYDGDSHVLATGARVLAADGPNVWLEVRRAEAPAVVAASARGDASLVLLPAG